MEKKRLAFNVTVINETGEGYFSQNREGVRDQLTPNLTVREGGKSETDRARERQCAVITTLDLTPGGGGELLRWRRLVSSKPSPVPDGEAPPSPPPLHERGVVGLHLVEESPPPTLLFKTTSHLNEEEFVAVIVPGLDLGSLFPHRKGITAGTAEADAAACDCLRRSSSFATTVSSDIAAVTHSSIIEKTENPAGICSERGVRCDSVCEEEIWGWWAKK